MSCTIVKAIWPGERTEDLEELRNAWGFAAIVWSGLSQLHLGWESHAWLTNASSTEKLQPLWDLGARTDIPTAHAAVMRMTFDLAYVRARHFPGPVADCRAFADAFPKRAIN